MDVRESKTLDVNDNSLRSRFEIALANRPDWAQSFTATMTGSRVRVTYSGNARFGVGLQEAWNYIERHDGTLRTTQLNNDAILDARDMAAEIEAARS